MAVRHRVRVCPPHSELCSSETICLGVVKTGIRREFVRKLERSEGSWFFRSCSERNANSRLNILATTHGYGPRQIVQQEDGEQAFSSFPVTIKRIRVTRWPAELQIDARERPAASENSRISEQTLKPILQKVRGVRRPRKSGSEERPLPPQTDPELESTDFYDSSRRRRAVCWLHSIDGDLADVIKAAASR